jgi:hypothetical protein
MLGTFGFGGGDYATVVTMIFPFNYPPAWRQAHFFTAHSKALLRHNQMFLFLRV